MAGGDPDEAARVETMRDLGELHARALDSVEEVRHLRWPALYQPLKIQPPCRHRAKEGLDERKSQIRCAVGELRQGCIGVTYEPMVGLVHRIGTDAECRAYDTRMDPGECPPVAIRQHLAPLFEMPAY